MCRELPPLLFSPATAPECSTRCNRHSPAAWQTAPVLAEPLTGSRSSLAHRNDTCSASGELPGAHPCPQGEQRETESLAWHGPVPPQPFIYRSDMTQRNYWSCFLEQCFHQQLIISCTQSAKCPS